MQVFWKYQSAEGQIYSVGLYHGDESGHVLIYCGKEIVKIDFNVLYSKSYSFYLGDELFGLEIDYKDGTRNYALKNLNLNVEIDIINSNLRSSFLDKNSLMLLLFILFLLVFLLKIVLY